MALLSINRVLISQTFAVEPVGGQTTESVTHGQCDARPTATFPVAERRRPLAGTKLYCLVTEAHGCEQLAQSCYLIADWLGESNRWHFDHESNNLTSKLTLVTHVMLTNRIITQCNALELHQQKYYADTVPIHSGAAAAAPHMKFTTSSVPWQISKCDQFPDFSLTAATFSDISSFLRQVVVLENCLKLTQQINVKSDTRELVKSVNRQKTRQTGEFDETILANHDLLN